MLAAKEIIFLVAIFFAPSGQPLLMDGWHPRQAPSLEACQEKAKGVRDYLAFQSIFKPIPPHRILCVPASKLRALLGTTELGA